MKNVLTNFLTTAAAVFGVVIFNPGNASALDIVVNSTSGDVDVGDVVDEVVGSGNASTTTFTGTLADPPIKPDSVTISDDNENHTDNGDGLLNITAVSNEQFGTGNGTATNFSGTLMETPIEPDSVVVEIDGSDELSDDENGVFASDATEIVNFGLEDIAQTFVVSIDTGVMSNDYSVTTSFINQDGNTDSDTSTITAATATPSAIALQLVNAINGDGDVNSFVEATDNMDGTLTITSTNGFHELTVTEGGDVPANSSVTETVPFTTMERIATLTGTLPEFPVNPGSVLFNWVEDRITESNLNHGSEERDAYVFSDDGEGSIRAYGLADVEIWGQAVGTIDYATGEVTLTLGAGESPRSIADIGNSYWYETRYDVEYQTFHGTVDYMTGAIDVTFDDAVPNSDSVAADYNYGRGMIDYATGAFSITFNSAPASAANNVVVDYVGCDETCALRDAIEIANGIPGADKITFDLLGDMITLQDTIGCVEDELTITGPGSSKLMIDAGGNASESYPILQIDPTDDNDCNGDWDPDDANPRDFYDLPFTMTGVTLTGGHDYPWFFSDVFSNVTLMDVVVTDNIVDSDEDEETGSVIITGSATLRNVKVTDNTVTDNTSECEGGGISIAGVGGTVLIENSTITGNNINLDHDEDNCGGAGLYMGGVQKTITVRNTLISDNVLYEDVQSCCNDDEPGGGGVKISGVALTVLLDRVTMDNNAHTVDNAELYYGGDQHGGGGIMISGEGGIFMIQNSSISNNTSDLDGGGLHASSGRIYIRNTMIANNSAKGVYRPLDDHSGSGSRYEFGGGGGIATSGNAQLELQGVTIRNNSTDQDGGGILLHGTPWFAGTSLDFLGGSITGNTAGRVGGGVNAWTGLANLGGVTVSGNHSDTRGGGISNLGKELNTSTDVTSETNSADFAKYELLIGKIILTSSSVGGNTSTSNTGRDCWGIIDNFGGAAIATRDFCEIVGSAILFGGVGGGGGGCTLSAKDAVPGSSMFLLLSAVGFMFIRERRRRNRA